jgi:hypothetical protein
VLRPNARFVMYKCPVNNAQGKQWFISVVEDGGTPGTNKDVDIYYAWEDTKPGVIYGNLIAPLKWSPFENVEAFFNTASPGPRAAFSWPNGELDPARIVVAAAPLRNTAAAAAASYAGGQVDMNRGVRHSSSIDVDDDLYGSSVVYH